MIFSRQKRGLSIVELVFVSSLMGLVFLATVMSLTQASYSQSKSERLFVADMLLSEKVELLREKPYGALDSLPGAEPETLNDFQFSVEAQSSDAPGGIEAKLVTVTVGWKDRNGEHIKARTFVRPRPR